MAQQYPSDPNAFGIPELLPSADPSVLAEPGGLLTIGALAQLCGVTVRTLRYYEEMDLITPIKRTQGRYRLYHPRSLKRTRAAPTRPRAIASSCASTAKSTWTDRPDTATRSFFNHSALILPVNRLLQIEPT